MAKDGTMRGGQRVGAGRKPKCLTEAVTNPKRNNLTVINLPADIDAPDPKHYLTERQKDDAEFEALDVYNETWHWLAERGCDRLVAPQLVRCYAMSIGRWIQCERDISQHGYMAPHPTTGEPIISQMVKTGQSYMKQATSLWYQINQVVREAGAAAAPDEPEDTMERLLRSRERG